MREDLVNELHRLIINNKDLDNLEGRANVFNPFKVLKIEQHELRHSNVLSWLLNPKENHGLGDLFLKRCISQVVFDNDNEIHVQFFH